MQEAPAYPHRCAAFSTLPKAVQSTSVNALRKRLQQVVARISALVPQPPVRPSPG